MIQCLVKLENGQMDIVQKDDKGFIVHQSQGRKAYYHPDFVIGWLAVDELDIVVEGSE